MPFYNQPPPEDPPVVDTEEPPPEDPPVVDTEEPPPEDPPVVDTEEPPPPVVDTTAPVYVSQTYVPDLPRCDRVKQNAVVVSQDVVSFQSVVTGFEPINPDDLDSRVAYLAEAPGGEWELGYLSGFSESEIGNVANRFVDTHHSSGGLTTLGGVSRIATGAEVTISLVMRSNSGVCVGGTPTVTWPKAAAFGDSAKAKAPAAIALGHKVVADRIGGSTLGAAGIGYLGVDIAGHQEHQFVVAAQTTDWTNPQTFTNNQRGLSTGYVGTGLVKLKATVCANYMGLVGGTPTMSPASDIALFDVVADLYVIDGFVAQVLSQQTTQTFAGANSVLHAVSLTPSGELVISAVSQVGAARAIALVTITDLSQSIFT